MSASLCVCVSIATPCDRPGPDVQARCCRAVARPPCSPLGRPPVGVPESPVRVCGWLGGSRCVQESLESIGKLGRSMACPEEEELRRTEDQGDDDDGLGHRSSLSRRAPRHVRDGSGGSKKERSGGKGALQLSVVDGSPILVSRMQATRIWVEAGICGPSSRASWKSCAARRGGRAQQREASRRLKGGVSGFQFKNMGRDLDFERAQSTDTRA